MSRLQWVKRYFTEARPWKVIGAVYAVHFLLYLTRYTSLNQALLIGLMLSIVVVLPVIALFKFIIRLWQLSNTERFPSDTFTYELAKTIPQMVIGIVFAIASIKGLLLLRHSHVATPPISLQTYLFIYAYSIGFWLFYFMSRLLNKKGE